MDVSCHDLLKPSLHFDIQGAGCCVLVHVLLLDELWVGVIRVSEFGSRFYRT